MEWRVWETQGKQNLFKRSFTVCSEALDKLNLNQQRNVFEKRGEKSLEGVSVHWHGDRFSMIFFPQKLSK